MKNKEIDAINVLITCVGQFQGGWQLPNEYAQAQQVIEELRTGADLTPDRIAPFAALALWLEKKVGPGVMNGAPYFVAAKKVLGLPEWKPKYASQAAADDLNKIKW